MNTSDVVEKLYESTPVSTLATLATSALFRSDRGDLNAIYGALAERSQGAQLRFSSYSGQLQRMIFTWALDVQSSYSRMAEFKYVCAAVPGVLDGLEKECAVFKFMAEAMNHRIIAAIEAMRQICDRRGIPFADVAQVAGVERMTLLERDTPAAPETVAMLLQEYGG